jgi:hypothetical protein
MRVERLLGRRGGEGGIRTHVGGMNPPNRLAGGCLQPLGHLSARATRPSLILGRRNRRYTRRRLEQSGLETWWAKVALTWRPRNARRKPFRPASLAQPRSALPTLALSDRPVAYPPAERGLDR